MPRPIPWLLLLLALAPPAHAQDDAPDRRPQTSPLDHAERSKRILELQARATAAIARRDYAEGERLLRENLALEPGSFVVLYNLACMRSRQDDAPGALDLLKQSIEAGFVDVHRLRSDPDLAPLRDEKSYRAILAGWPRVLAAHLEANLKHAGRIFDGRSGPYATTRDDKLRVAVMSAMDPVSSDQARADIARLHDWGLAHVFPDLAAGGAEDDPWAVVVLPTQRDFRKWLVATYGMDAVEGLSSIGGHYDHDQKRLVAMDLGATLRHEFFHVLHWRSATRLGQDHPIWIQEGLCSLVEDYDLLPEGSPATLRPAPSWRSNIAKRLMSGGRLMPIRQLATLRRDRFSGSNPLANYGQARTLFLYLHDSGKLRDWYAHYTAHYDEDPTGVKSIEAVFDLPIDKIDRAYRAWLKVLPEVAEQTRPGDVGIGADVESGDGDGPVIVAIPRDGRRRPSPARRAGLRVGDVITGIDGQPTRDLNELVRILGQRKAGDTIELSFRRGRAHDTVTITLEAR